MLVRSVAAVLLRVCLHDVASSCRVVACRQAARKKTSTRCARSQRRRAPALTKTLPKSRGIGIKLTLLAQIGSACAAGWRGGRAASTLSAFCLFLFCFGLFIFFVFFYFFAFQIWSLLLTFEKTKHPLKQPRRVRFV